MGLTESARTIMEILLEALREQRWTYQGPLEEVFDLDLSLCPSSIHCLVTKSVSSLRFLSYSPECTETVCVSKLNSSPFRYIAVLVSSG